MSPFVVEGPEMSESREQYIVNGKGEKKSIVLPPSRYRRLLADLHDLAIVAERRRERPIPILEMKRRLKQDG
jgi:hypothetical protein